MNLRNWVVQFTVLLLIGRVVQSEPTQGLLGPQGSRGPQGKSGPPGNDGVPGSAALATLQVKVDALQAKIDALEAQRMAPDCLSGYNKAEQPEAPFLANIVLCAKGADEIVRVGKGPGKRHAARETAAVRDANRSANPRRERRRREDALSEGKGRAGNDAEREKRTKRHEAPKTPRSAAALPQLARSAETLNDDLKTVRDCDRSQVNRRDATGLSTQP